MSRAVYNVREVADLLLMSPTAVRGAIRAGALLAHRLGSKGSRLRVRDADLRAYLDRGRRGPLLRDPRPAWLHRPR